MNVIRKDMHIDALGMELPYWKILTIQADFVNQTLVVLVGGWLDRANLDSGKSPLYSFTAQFSAQMVQQYRRDYFTAVENGANIPVPDFEALSFDVLPSDFTYDYVVSKIMDHPAFAPCTLCEGEDGGPAPTEEG